MRSVGAARLGRGRRGASLVVLAAFMVPLLAMVAFAIDVGYLLTARTQLQASADAAAMAGAWELVDTTALSGQPSTSVVASNARTKAAEFAGYNRVACDAPLVDANAGNSSSGDIVLGNLANLTDPSLAINTVGTPVNAVQVTVRRNASRNGEIRLFFAPLLGINTVPLEAQATAALSTNSIKGFRAPADGTNLELLPYALDEETWNSLQTAGSDDWRWDDAARTISGGADGIKEVNLFPQGTGSPGNRGTVDIGSSNNSTADLARQIVYGISASDLAHHGGSLQFNAQGNLYLNGDTGISAGVKDELASIRGKPRAIPVFRSVTGPGNNATYTIVKFVGIRILDVKLTGAMSGKRVTIQPANLVAKGALEGTTQGTTQYIYSPVRLVR